MVAAHSIVRVSVCRANNGMQFFNLLFFFLKIQFACVDVHCNFHSNTHSVHSSSCFPAQLKSAFRTNLADGPKKVTVTLLSPSSRWLLEEEQLGRDLMGHIP